jgi:hypothetical protein
VFFISEYEKHITPDEINAPTKPIQKMAGETLPKLA